MVTLFGLPRELNPLKISSEQPTITRDDGVLVSSVRRQIIFEGTELDIHGLELDWAGVCWDGDFRFVGRTRAHYRRSTGNTYQEVISRAAVMTATGTLQCRLLVGQYPRQKLPRTSYSRL